ncbi:uncharacterized protein [Centruroides vittatus]|uniref:uncharacterized protein n=1 Tax=Centruroides vittatus TaxID=120091 RepID=UPI00350EBE87
MPGRGRTQGSKRDMPCSEDQGGRADLSQSQEIDTKPEKEILDPEVEVTDNQNEIEGRESDELEKLRLQIRQAEIETKNKEIETKNKEIETKNKEIETKNKEIESKTKEMETQIRLAEIEVRKSEIELERDRLRSDSRTSDNSELRGNLDSLARKIRWALPKMPDKEAEVPSWFRAVEVVLQTYDVPEELQGQLVLTVLSEKCKTALNRLTADEIRDYQTLKQFLLDELRLSAAEYLKEFTSAEKGSKETWPQFAARMEDLYRYYLNSRGVDSFGQLTKLVVSDHLKTKLDADTKRYVLLQEGKGWLLPEEIDRYTDKHAEAVEKGDVRLIPERERDRTVTRTGGMSANNGGSRMRCYVCDQMGHLRRDCPRRNIKEEGPKPKATRAVKIDETVESDEQLVARVKVNRETISGNVPVSRNENLLLTCKGNKFSAIVDTGVDMTVIKKSVVPVYVSRVARKVKLISAFGQQISAVLATIPVRVEGRSSKKKND